MVPLSGTAARLSTRFRLLSGVVVGNASSSDSMTMEGSIADIVEADVRRLLGVPCAADSMCCPVGRDPFLILVYVVAASCGFSNSFGFALGTSFVLVVSEDHRIFSVIFFGDSAGGWGGGGAMSWLDCVGGDAVDAPRGN
jgi:hypothetical protein